MSGTGGSIGGGPQEDQRREGGSGSRAACAEGSWRAEPPQGRPQWLSSESGSFLGAAPDWAVETTHAGGPTHLGKGPSKSLQNNIEGDNSSDRNATVKLGPDSEATTQSPVHTRNSTNPKIFNQWDR